MMLDINSFHFLFFNQYPPFWNLTVSVLIVYETLWNDYTAISFVYFLDAKSA